MVDLDFTVEQARVARHTAAPTLVFALRLTNLTPAAPVRNVLLRCQIRIEPTRRGYKPMEQERLSDLFGSSPRWGETLRGLLWTHANALVPAFDGDCSVELPVPCTYDFNIAATKYFDGLDDGEVPLSFLFSGSIFYTDESGRLQIDQVAWSKEAGFRLPVATWRDMMERYYPNSVWLCLERDSFDRLYRYKRQRGLATFERAIDSLLSDAPAEAP